MRFRLPRVSKQGNQGGCSRGANSLSQHSFLKSLPIVKNGRRQKWRKHRGAHRDLHLAWFLIDSYRGTSLIRNRPLLGPYSSICLGPYGGHRGGAVSYG